MLALAMASVLRRRHNAAAEPRSAEQAQSKERLELQLEELQEKIEPVSAIVRLARLTDRI
jgi:hypothetical protein